VNHARLQLLPQNRDQQDLENLADDLAAGRCDLRQALSVGAEDIARMQLMAADYLQAGFPEQARIALDLLMLIDSSVSTLLLESTYWEIAGDAKKQTHAMRAVLALATDQDNAAIMSHAEQRLSEWAASPIE